MKKLCRYIVITQLILLLICVTGFSGYNIQESVRDIVLEKSLQEFQAVRTYQIALGDIDNDGDPDAVLSNMGSNDSQVLINDGKGNFSDSGQKITQEGHGVELGDLDSDGDLDFIMTCASEEKKTKIYFNDGKGNFHDSLQDLGDLELSGNSVELIDFDADGDLDVFIVYYQHPNKIYLNDGKGIYSASTTEFADNLELAWEDLDSDGDVDIFVKDLTIGYKTMLNDGKGNFTDHWQKDDEASSGHSAALGDLDKDGDLDAIIVNGDNSGSHPTLVYMNDGTGRFTDSGQRLPETKWGCVSLGDLNNDGNLDAFVSNFGPANMAWIGDGKGNLFDSGLRHNENTLNSKCTLSDLDNDGDLDVLVATFINGPNEIWFNKTKDSAPAQKSALDGSGGGLIAFYSEKRAAHIDAEIYIMNADGSGETRLTNNNGQDLTPDISPDGSQIAFKTNRDGNFEIYKMDIDGSNLTRLTNTQENESYPYWSPDGKKIIFSRDHGRNKEIHLMSCDGTGDIRLTNNTVNDEWAYLSPDMQKIVFSSGSFPDYDIYTMDIDGSNRELLLDSPNLCGLPKWSRDGQKIAFGSAIFDSGSLKGDVYIINTDGNYKIKITDTNGKFVSENPYWSPEGTRIVFQSNRGGNFQLYSIDTNGNNIIRLTNHDGNDYWPGWSIFPSDNKL
ncbi:MAG: hypothetical protein GY863_15290 [bacterium]|nr:hypothetical protein [bacterium]